MIFIALLLGVPDGKENLWWYLTYTTNILTGLNNGHCGYFTHLWSLAVEEQFYIFFPFIVLLVPNKHLFKAFFTILGLAFFSRLLVCMFGPADSAVWITYTWTPCCMDAFAIGAILAYLKMYHPDRLLRILKMKYLFVLSLIVCIIIFIAQDFKPFYSVWVQLTCRLTFSIFSFWVIGMGSMSLYKGIFKRLISNRVITYLGRITYGIYVYHHFIPFVFGYLGYKADNHTLVSSSLLYFIATIFVSSASWHFFEEPINKLKKYFNYQFSEPAINKQVNLEPSMKLPTE